MPSNSDVAFSIVINTLNRADYLDDAIRGVCQLDYDNFELIVVNGPSTDRTEEILIPWSNRIKLRSCSAANLSVSRNVGIEAASGDVVAFLDDDAVPHPEWLRRLSHHYADPRIGAVGGFTIDNSGCNWQVRKTICDRFGNAHNVDNFFDERALNFPGTPYYPSLLGTNSSFRRSALYEIGGFDHTFAYLLDETDVCLRLVDAGWRVAYEPDALVFHQFAESHVRTSTRKPRTLFPSVVSKTYFIYRHGRHDGRVRQANQLEGYRDEILRANKWLAEHNEITFEHRRSLDLDVERGIEVGTQKAHAALGIEKAGGDLALPCSPGEFRNLASLGRLRVALVSRGYPPHNDSGIARWTAMVARGLSDLGVDVHVITHAVGQPWRRYQNGIWVHAIAANEASWEDVFDKNDVPIHLAQWMAAVMDEIAFIKTFGLDIVSFPIWDLEALPILADNNLASVLSLHTTYKLARPFKPEWDARILYGRKAVDKVIAAEREAMLRAPNILANSATIISQIEEAYDISIADRCMTVPHGTTDILKSLDLPLSEKLANNRRRGGLRVMVPGRFELRKGYDLSLRIAYALRDREEIHFDFVGQTIDERVKEVALADSGVELADLSNATIHGTVERAELDFLYAKADVVLMLSRFESFGLVAVEAMAAATPVIALAGGALPEVIDEGRSGWLFAEREDSIDNVVNCLRALADDRARVDATSETAYAAYQEKFSVEAMARGILAAYRSALGTKEVLHD